MKRIYHVLSILAASVMLLGLGSCAKEEFGEETQAGFTFSISAPIPQEVVPTKATDAQETRIEQLALFFYENNSTPLVIELGPTELGTPTQTSSTNYVYTVTLGEDSGITTAMNYLYAVANYGKSNFGSVSLSELSAKTRSEMDALFVDNNNELLDMTETSMLLTGKFAMSGTSASAMPTGAITIKESDNPKSVGTLHLRRIASKTTFTFINGTGVTFTPTSYKVCNYSRSSTLFERNCWSPDYYTGTVATADHAGNDSFINIDGMPGGLLTSGGRTSFTFYMQENAQTTLPSGASIAAYGDREKSTYSGDDRTFTNAPEHATYVVVKGNYNDAGYSGVVQYTIHLGDFGDGKFNNFSVRRNTKYQYNVTVNGVNNIVVEATTNVENQPGAEGNLITKATALTDVTLDAHYETVMIKLPLAAISQYSLRVSTPFTTLNYNSLIDGAAPSRDDVDVSWVKFCAPTSTTAFAEYPGTANFLAGNNSLTDIFGLLESLSHYGEAGQPVYYVADDTSLYIQANVDEYYYEGKDRSTFIDADTREMTLAQQIAMSSDGHSSVVKTPSFSIKQRSIKSVYNVAAENPVGIENVSEFDHKIACESGDVSGGQPVKTMDGLGTSSTNGWQNFFGEIISDSSWSTYVQAANNGHFDSSQYVPDSSMTHVGNYAIYQCLAKNRDENGNGTIDAAEKKWYLPASQQYFNVWYGTPALESDVVLTQEVYYTSTGGNERAFWALQGALGGHDDENLTAYVRCARTLSSPSAVPSIPYSYYNSANVVSLDKVNPSALRTSGSQTGEYLEGHFSSDTQNILPQAFKIADEELSIPIETSGSTAFTVSTNYSTYSGSLSNLYDGDASTFWWSSQAQTTGKYVLLSFSDPIMLESLTVTGIGSTDYPHSTNELQVSSDNSRWTTVGTFSESTVSTFENINTACQYVRIYATGDDNHWLKIGEISVTCSSDSHSVIYKSTFDKSDILTKNYCAEYYAEEEDKSDLGYWRIPNNRELLIMFSLGELSNGSASRTVFDRGGTKGLIPYYVVGDAITSNGTADNLKIRCVRDVPPITSGTVSGGSGYDTGSNKN